MTTTIRPTAHPTRPIRMRWLAVAAAGLASIAGGAAAVTLIDDDDDTVRPVGFELTRLQGAYTSAEIDDGLEAMVGAAVGHVEPTIDPALAAAVADVQSSAGPPFGGSPTGP